MCLSPNEIQNAVISDINSAGDVLSQYTYLLQMAAKLPAMSEEDKCLATLVDGCQSQVWLRSWRDGDRIYYQATSDTLIVRGLLHLIIKIYSGAYPEQIRAMDLRFLAETDLGDTLEPSRRSGVQAILRDMRKAAE